MISEVNMKKYLILRTCLLSIFINCFLFIIVQDKVCAQGASDYVFIQSIPTNQKVYLIKETDKYDKWESDSKNLLGKTPLKVKLDEGSYLLVVRSKNLAGIVYPLVYENIINDGEIRSGIVIVGNQGEVEFYKEYSIMKEKFSTYTLTSIFMKYGNSLNEILKNIPQQRNFEYDFKPEVVNNLFYNLKIQTEEFPIAIEILKKIGVIVNKNGIVSLTTSGGFRTSLKKFDPPINLKKFLIKLYVTPDKKKETITFQSDEYEK